MKNIKSILRPFYYATKDLFDINGNKLMKNNFLLKNKYSGKRCFLLSTGESISRLNLSLLRNEYTMGINFIFLHSKIKKINMTFYKTDGHVKTILRFPLHWPENLLKSKIHERPLIYFKKIEEIFPNSTTLFLNGDNFNFYLKNNLFYNSNNLYLTKQYNALDKFDPQKYIIDPTKRMPAGGGGLYNAILMLIYLGFSEIYLCGAGYTYQPNYCLHFYDNFFYPRSIGKEKALKKAAEDINYQNKKWGSSITFHGFFEDLFSFRTVLVEEKSIEYSHIIINKFAEINGVKIRNIVPEGFESPVYDKISWKEVMNTL